MQAALNGIKRFTLYGIFIIFCYSQVISASDFQKMQEGFKRFTDYVENKLLKQAGWQQLQDIVNGLPYLEKKFNIQLALESMTSEISKKMIVHIKIVKSLAKEAERPLVKQNEVERNLCCGYESNTLQSSEHFGEKMMVDLDDVCEIVSGNSQNEVTSTSDSIRDLMKNNFEKSSSSQELKWQYVGTEQGLLTIYPASSNFTNCTSIDPRFRSWYIEVSRPEIRNVVIALDTSQSMWTSTYTGQPLINISSDVIETLLQMLDPRDNISFVSFNNNATRGPGCFKNGFVAATKANKQLLQDYIANIRPNGQSFYEKGFEESFKIFAENSESSKGVNILMLVSDGRPNEAYEGLDDFYEYVERERKKVGQDIKFFIVGVGRYVQKNIMEKLVSLDSDGEKTKNKSIVLNKPEHLRNSMHVFLRTGGGEPVISLPYIDQGNLGLICTIGLSIYDKDGIISGVVATDISIESVFQSVFDYGKGNFSYAFVIKKNGEVFLHPLLPTPQSKTERPYRIHINQFECFDSNFLSEITSGNIGNRTVQLNNSRCFAPFFKNDSNKVTYYWAPINSTDLYVVIVTHQKFEQTAELEFPEIWKYNLNKKDKSFIYHRLDLDDSMVTCSFFGRSATVNLTTTQWAPRCFHDSHKYLIDNENRISIKEYTNFFTELSSVSSYKEANEVIDKYRSTYNKFKTQAVYDTLWSTLVNKIWNESNENVAAFLLGTDSGVIRILPGGKFPKNYDVTKRTWYRLARSNPGRTVFSPAYVDAVGVGRIITISLSLGKYASDFYQVLAVMGIDLSLKQFQEIFHNLVKVCAKNYSNEVQYHCALVNEVGEIVYEDDYIDKPIFTLKHIAGDRTLMSQLQKENFVKIEKCLDHVHNRYKQSYKLHPNLYLNKIDGPVCGKNIMVPINGTNIFLLIRPEYYYCYASDCYDEHGEVYVCKNGIKENNSTWKYIECPCRQHIDSSDCSNPFTNQETYPSCIPDLPELQPSNECISKNLEKCFEPNCHVHVNESSCTAKTSQCTWCVMKDETNQLIQPYCTPTEICFNGIEGQLPTGFDKRSVCVTQTPGLSLTLVITLICISIFIIIFICLFVFFYIRKKRHRKHESVENAEMTEAPATSLNNLNNKKLKKNGQNEIRVMISVLDGDGNQLFCKPVQLYDGNGSRRQSSASSSTGLNQKKKNKIPAPLKRIIKQKKDLMSGKEDESEAEERSLTPKKLRKKEVSLRRRTISESFQTSSPLQTSVDLKTLDKMKKERSTSHPRCRDRLSATSDWSGDSCLSNPFRSNPPSVSSITSSNPPTNYINYSSASPASADLTLPTISNTSDGKSNKLNYIEVSRD